MTQTEALRALIAKLDTTRPCMGSPSECGVPNFGEELEAARAALAQPSPTAETVDREAIADTMRLVEYDMVNRQTGRGDGFVGERAEVAKLIVALRLALTTPTLCLAVEGWRLAPEVPTEAMLWEGRSAYDDQMPWGNLEEVWSAMLAAAIRSPSREEGSRG